MGLKSAPLLIKSITLIPIESLSTGDSDESIISGSINYPKIYFTPGSAQLASSNKNSSSGRYWEHDLAYSFPGLITAAAEEIIKKVGAIVIETMEGRTLVFYKNDYFSNTKLRPEIVTAQSKTSVKFTITSLYSL